MQTKRKIEWRLVANVSPNIYIYIHLYIDLYIYRYDSGLWFQIYCLFSPRCAGEMIHFFPSKGVSDGLVETPTSNLPSLQPHENRAQVMLHGRYVGKYRPMSDVET